MAQKIIETANRKGMTVYNFTNEILQQAIRAESMNRSLPEIVERFRVLEIARDSGVVFVRNDMLLYMVDRLYQQGKEELFQKWYEFGHWYGKYLQIKINDGAPLDMLEELLETCACKPSEVRINRDGDKLSVNTLSPNDSSEYTELVSRFLEGILHSFGYETKSRDVSKGLLTLEFEKANSDNGASRKTASDSKPKNER